MASETTNQTVNIKVSKITLGLLDSLRHEIVGIISKINDLDLMKKIEKCSYDKLIMLLNIGFSEKAFFDILNGNSKMKREVVIFSETAKRILEVILYMPEGESE